MPYQPAVLGPNTRLNNFRLNYLTAAQAGDRPTHIRIILGGIDITGPAAPVRVLHKSISIRDALFDAPNTCALTLYGAAPTVGQSLEIWINSNAPVLLFGGELQTVARTYKGRPTTVIHPVTAIDDTARANRRRPLMPFVNVSATTIAQTLMSTYAPGFSVAGVEAGLPPVSINFDGSEGGMKGCLTALAKLIGGYWYFENKTLYFFRTPPGPPPDALDHTPGRFLHDPAITWTIDKSQVRTRVYGKGASTQIAASVAAQTELVPIENMEMFNPSGGRAIAGITPDGAASRVVTYTGIQLGGGGGLVGPGAAPSGPPGLLARDGFGMELGAHYYAYTFVTAAGESLPGPISGIWAGVLAAPSAPGVGAATNGGAVDPGTHTYGVTFVTAMGETTIDAASATVTIPAAGAPVPAPSTAPTPGAATAGGAIDPGSHYYTVTFQTANGETTIAPVTVGVNTFAAPAGVPLPGTTTAGLRKVVGALAPGVAYRYQTTMTIAGGGESLPGGAGAAITPVVMPGPPGVSASYALETGGLVVDQVYVYTMSFIVGGSYETAIGPQLVVDLPPDPLYTQVVFQYLTASPDARVTGRKLYRWAGGQWRLVTTIPDNNPNTWYRDGASDASLGAVRAGEGAIGTPPGDQATVILPTSPDGRVTGRKVYRSDNGAPYRYLTTVSNNTATQVVDDTASVAANALAPTGDTTGGTALQTVHLTAIATGPAAVTGRKLYRYSGAGPYRLLATIANNTTTTFTDTIATASLGAEPPTTNTATSANTVRTVPITGIAIGLATVTARKLYRSTNGAPYKLLATIANNQTTTYSDTTAAASLGAAPPTTNSTYMHQVQVTVPIGATAVTARKIYRTAANQTPLLLVTTIANNTATTYLDSTIDVNLGAAGPPMTDTSGLTQPNGQVPAGSTAILVANPAPFPDGGGWAVVGNGEQTIRYTGKSATALTGVPAAGPGAIVAAIAYNSTITAAPALTGVVGLVDAVIRNSPIHVWVQRDDTAAQAYMVTLDGGGDGVYEHIWSDERRTEASLIQVCDAQLALYSRPIVTVTYASRDLKTKSGKVVAVSLSAPAIHETLTIQDVAITEIGMAPRLAPKFTVTASNVHQSFEAVLQMLIRKADA